VSGNFISAGLRLSFVYVRLRAFLGGFIFSEFLIAYIIYVRMAFDCFRP